MNDLFAAEVEVEEEIPEQEAVEVGLPAPSATTTLETASVALSLEPYQQQVKLMFQEAQAIQVRDTASNQEAVAKESRIKKLYKRLEDSRKAVVRPYNERVKEINNLFKMLTDQLAQGEAQIKKVRGQYDLHLEMERRRKEAELREEQRKLQAKLEAEARAQREEAAKKAREAEEKLKQEQDEATRAALQQEIEEEQAAACAPTPVAPPIVAEKPAVVRTAEGSSYTKFKWVCRVVEADKVPRNYCDPNQKKLDEAVKGGERNIPGCVVEEVAIPVTRV